MTIRCCTARSIVLYMKAGAGVADAVYEAAEDMRALKGGLLSRVTIHAIDRKGDYKVVARAGSAEPASRGTYCDRGPTAVSNDDDPIHNIPTITRSLLFRSEAALRRDLRLHTRFIGVGVQAAGWSTLNRATNQVDRTIHCYRGQKVLLERWLRTDHRAAKLPCTDLQIPCSRICD